MKKNNKWAAYEIFKDMRPSTPAEQQLYEQMIKKCSTSLEGSIWNMGEIEIDYCDICHQKKEVQRKYYYYGIDCDCCGSPLGHFEIVRYCSDCTPEPPKYIKAQMKPKFEE